MAGELATRLEQDQPCPVCGAHDHPSPAPTGDLVSADDVAATEDSWQKAATQVSDAERALAGLEATIGQLREQLGDDLRDLPTLEAAAAAAAAEHSTASQAAAGLGTARAHLAALRVAVESETNHLAALRHAATTAASRVQALDAELATERAALAEEVEQHAGSCPCAEHLGDDSSRAEDLLDPDLLDATLTHHESATSAVRAHLTSVRELDRATREHAEVLAATDESFAGAGFPDPVQARAGLLRPLS